MTDYAFINKESKISYLGIMKADKLIDYQAFSPIEGNIYRGRIIKFVKALNGYIIDLGLEKNGILRKHRAPKNLQMQEDVLVELLQESTDDKLHELTAKYSITDGYYVLVNQFDKKPKVFLRTAGKELDESLKKARLKDLQSKFDLISQERYLLPTPKKIYQNEKLKNALETIKLDLVEAEDIKYHSNIQKALSEIDNQSIITEDGISLVFDQLEALTVIDINAGAYALRENKDKHGLKVNLTCVDELSRLIKVKGIKKMLIVDFLRMNKKEDRDMLELEFLKALDKYNISYQKFGFTRMGLYELVIR